MNLGSASSAYAESGRVVETIMPLSWDLTVEQQRAIRDAWKSTQIQRRKQSDEHFLEKQDVLEDCDCPTLPDSESSACGRQGVQPEGNSHGSE